MEGDDWNSASDCDSASVANKCQILEPYHPATSDEPLLKRPRTLQGLNRHLANCPGIPKNGNVRVGRKIDRKAVRELMARMVIEHDLPFEFVEWNGFRTLAKYISGDEAPCVSRDDVAADVMRVYLLEKEKLKKELASLSGRVCLTFRCWTSDASHGYFTLAAHYVDEDWKLNVKLLNFGHLGLPHDNFEVSQKVISCLCEWGIARKVFSITVDNASSNDELRNLKEILCRSKCLPSGREFFQFKCCAHVFDLIAQESLKVVSDFTQKISKSVKHVSVSFSRLKQFKEEVEEVGDIDTKDGVHLDVSGKWNSTYLMLDSAIKYRCAFERLSFDIRYKHYPSNEEWERGETICKFLKSFYELSSMSSGPKCHVSSTYLFKIWWIELSLRKMKLSEDHVIRDMATKMVDEFDKYLSEYSMILAFGFALDPCLKLEFLELAYLKLDPDISSAKDKVNNVRKALSALFNEYANKGASTSSTKRKNNSIFAELIELREQERQKKYAAGMTQLDLYLEEPTLDYGDTTALDYWKNHGRHRYGDLARMARDVLSFPIFAVASESAFSIGSSVLNKYRSCMISENLQALVCSRNWIYGFSHTGQFGVVERTRRIDLNMSKLDSNGIVKYESEEED